SRGPSAMHIAGADVAFDTQHPVVAELMIIAELDAAKTPKYPGLVAGGREGRADELGVGAGGGRACEPAGIEAGPVGRPDRRARPLDHLGRHRGCDRFWRELADASVAGPAFDVFTIAIVDANEAEPARVDELRRDAKRVLAVGPDAGCRRLLGDIS